MCDLMNNNHFKPHQTTINKNLKLNLQIIKLSNLQIFESSNPNYYYLCIA